MLGSTTSLVRKNPYWAVLLFLHSYFLLFSISNLPTSFLEDGNDFQPGFPSSLLLMGGGVVFPNTVLIMSPPSQKISGVPISIEQSLSSSVSKVHHGQHSNQLLLQHFGPYAPSATASLNYLSLSDHTLCFDTRVAILMLPFASIACSPFPFYPDFTQVSPPLRNLPPTPSQLVVPSGCPWCITSPLISAIIVFCILVILCVCLYTSMCVPFESRHFKL